MKNIIFYLSLVIATLVSFNSVAEPETQKFSDAELAQMLAPIALYPDSLLTHILIASTYPIEIVEAHRWLKKNKGLSAAQMSKSLESYEWDASVKALIPFERVLSQLSEDLSWTQQLGDAFLQDESQLLLSIQSLRKQAKVAGSLKEMKNMDIRYEDNNILILPREKEIVYVPYYDSRVVYGSWFWAGYPPVYWNSYRRSNVNHYRPFHWNTGVHINFNYFFSAFHWHNRHVVVVAPHRSHYRSYSQRPRRLISHGGYAKRWSHKPSHRKGVAYRTKKTREKYHSKRVKTHRSNKQQPTHSKMRHHNAKQRLHAANHSPNKVKGNVNNRVKHTKDLTRPTNKKNVIQHRSHSKSATKSKQSHKMSDQTRKQQRTASKRDNSSVKKQRQQNYRVANSSNHKSERVKRSHSSTSKERK